jgi:hypothetical protein
MQSVSALYLAPELNIAFGHLSKSRVLDAGYRLLAATSPQCQPTTVRKDNNLDRIEHTITSCRLKIQTPLFGSRL